MSYPAVTQRRVFKGARTPQGEIRDLLSAVFAEEMLLTSAEVTIIAPWVSDISVFDNQSGAFFGLNPDWPHRAIRLTEVLVHLAQIGTDVRIAVRPDDHNRLFARKMIDAAEEGGVRNRLRLVAIDNLHTKGLLGGSWVILGSMNLTWNGIEINEEYVSYETDREAISQARLHFRELVDSAGPEWCIT
jgi:hypothetical protein